MKKTKKILSLVLSIAMLCTIFTAFSMTANAQAVTTAGTFDELQNVIFGATEPLTINITKDIKGGVLHTMGGNITINLNSHTVECSIGLPIEGITLTVNGPGTLKGIDGNSPSSAIQVLFGSKFEAKNINILGGNTTAQNGAGAAAINVQSANIKLDNCYVAAGKSQGTAENPPAIYAGSDDKIFANNCTFVRDTVGSGKSYNVVTGMLCDFAEVVIPDIDYTKSPLVIGKGYAGNQITDADGTPKKGYTPVTANATIPEPTYTVTIPASIDIGNVNGALEKYRKSETDKDGKKIIVEKPFAISATGVDNLFDGKKLIVSIGTKDIATTMTGNGNTVPCKLNKGTVAYTEGAEFASFTNDVDLAVGEENKQSGAIVINRCDITKSADYTGTLTFNIEIKEGI